MFYYIAVKTPACLVYCLSEVNSINFDCYQIDLFIIKTKSF